MKYLKKTLKIVLWIILLTITTITIIFGHKDIPVHSLKAEYANEASSFIEINGMNVHFRDEGDKTDSAPIVLIHGTASSLHTFEGWTSRLKSDYRVISLDLPGYGLTGPFPNGNYSIDNYIDFIRDFLSALHLKKCIIAGNSLGGQIAWNFTLQNPNLVNKLILIDAAGYPTESKTTPLAFRLAKIPIINKSLTYITPKYIVQKSVKNVYVDQSKVTPELVNRYYNLTLRKGNRKAFIDKFSVPIDTLSYKRICEIKQPTLVLWGEKDKLIPVEMAYNFHRDLPNDTLIVLKNLGHVPMEEDWQKSIKPVLDFLKI